MNWVRVSVPTAAMPALVLSLLLAACGGGGGGGGGGGNDTGSTGSGAGNGSQTSNGGSGSSASQTQVYDYWVNGSQLRSLVRGDSNAKVVDLGPYTSKTQFWLYTKQAALGANVELDVRNSVLLYIANNHFYRLATAGTSQPLPVQVSSENAAGSICDWHDPVLNTPNNDNASFKYRLPGADGQCSTADDQYREIRVGMNAGDAPQVIDRDRFRADEVFTAAGQLAGYLVARSSGGIYWYDAGFANPRQIASGVLNVDSYSDFLPLAISPDGRYRLLQLFTVGIYVFDSNTQQMTKVVDAGGSSTALGYFGGRFYVYRSLNGTRSILQLPADGSAAATELVGNLAGSASMVGQYLIYPQLAASGSGQDIYSLDLAAGGGAKRIKSLAANDQLTVGGGRLYYRMYPASSGGASTAGSLLPDGSDDVGYDGAWWVGVGFHNGAQTALPGLQADYIYLVQGVSFTANGAWQGGNLSWVDAATGRIGGSLGAMPAGINNFAFVSTDYAGMGLGVGYAGTGANQVTLYLRADRRVGKVSLVDQSPADWGYFWKSDWSAAQ